MTWLKEIVQTLTAPRNNRVVQPSKPTVEQIETAKAILAITKAGDWPLFQDVLENDICASLDKAFQCVKEGNFNTLPLFVMQAYAKADVLRKIEWAGEILLKSNPINTPLR